ncbi:MAG TPA: fibronectin type III domain-containing protein, partial [Acidimicrobiales bacterium]
STSECVAVGSTASGAGVDTTTDGGATWTGQTVSTGSIALTAVSCATTSDCTAVGSAFNGTTTVGAILATSDSGTTWSAPTLPSGVGALTAVSCPSATVCEATWSTFSGRNVSATGIVATTDGGTIWSIQTVPSGVSLSGVSCASVTTCEAVGGTTSNSGYVLTTTNGGTTWTPQTLPGGVSGLFGISCPSVSFCATTGFAVSGYSVLTTTDGGITWTVVTLTSSSNSPTSIACATATTCEAFGTNFNSSTSAADVFATTDGGVNWTPQSLPGGVGPFAAVSCPTAICVAVGTGSTGAAVSTSADGGATWTAQPPPTGVSGLTGVSCASAATCEAVGVSSTGPATALVTTDGGATWTSQTLPVAQGTLDGISCATTTTCEAVGGNVVLATTDGGAVWVNQNVPAGVSSLSGVSCVSATTCEAVGYNYNTVTSTSTGVVLATTDGGGTWVAQTTPAGTGTLTGVSCATATACEAVGATTSFGPTILATTNGGTTWTTQSVPSGVFSLAGISCVSTTTCEAVGGALSAAGVVSTTDSGAIWTIQAVPPGDSNLATVSCTSASDCVAGGSGTGAVGGLLLSYGQLAIPVPTVTSISPTTGPAVGGITVTVTGSGLTGATGVSFGTAPATSYQEVSDTEVTAVAPEGTSTVDITVTTPGGTSAIGASDLFTYQAAIAPTSPTGLAASLGNGTATLSWSAPASDGGSALTSYVVSATDTTTSTTLPAVVVSGSPPSTSTTLTGLTPGDAYSFTVAATNAVGTGPASSVLSVLLPAPFHALPPARICDTRTTTVSGITDQCSGKTLGQGSTLIVQVTGTGGVPQGATAVVANITVTNPTNQSYLTAWPAGTPRPPTSNLNFSSGQTVPNLTTVPLSANGALDIYNAAGTVDVIVDATGYYGPGTVSSPGVGFTPLVPARICDTRPTNVSGGAADQCTGKTPGAGADPKTLTVQVTGNGGVPAGATAVVANITVTNPSTPGYLTAYPDGTTRPLASNLNFITRQTVPNRVIVPLSVSGAIDIYNANGSVDVIVDVTGYYSSSSTGMFEALPPARICDTRPTAASGLTDACTGKTVAAAGTLTVPVTGIGGVPTTASGIVANVTVTGTTAGSFLTVYPATSTRPLASDLNWTPRTTVPNLVVAELGTNGALGIYNAQGSTNVIVDVAGWFTP